MNRKYAAILCLVAHTGAAGPVNVSAPIKIGSNPTLFVDRTLVESLRGATLCLHRPILREVVFRFDAAWEGPECGYVTVLQDGALYRLYYRGGGETTQEVTCMAESRDGIRWERPNFGLFEFNGSKSNNIVLRGTTKAYSESHNFTPFLDSNPASAKPAPVAAESNPISPPSAPATPG